MTTHRAKMTMPRIEEIWSALRSHGVASQRRIDAEHPRDLYADFAPPDQIGLIAICSVRPSLPRPLRAISVELGHRDDGRWSLRIALHQPTLLPVFAALCDDIVGATTSGIDEAQLGTAVLARLQRWRSLLERDAAGLDEATLRGLIGELVVLRSHLIPLLGARAGIAAWRGPRGAPQDFLLPDGQRIEVKAVNWDAGDVQINGLQQLDPGPDELTLAVVRLQVTGSLAQSATNAPRLVGQVRELLVDEPDTLAEFNDSLALVGWHDHSSHDELVVRIMSIEVHPVVETFPRLTISDVPPGVTDVVYRIALPMRNIVTWPVIDD